jgi:capsid protein
MLSEALLKKIEVKGFVESFDKPDQYDILGAWTSVQWFGSIKPSTDMLKQAKGSQLLVNNGWSTSSKESRSLTGTKFNINIKKRKRENELLAESLRPMLELKAEFGEQQVNEALNAVNNGEISSVDLTEVENG